MPFKSRKQQQWYNATNQDYLDDEPSSHRKVEEDHWDMGMNAVADAHNWWKQKSKEEQEALKKNMVINTIQKFTTKVKSRAKQVVILTN